MYYKKPEFTSKVFNYQKQYNDQLQESNNGGNVIDKSTASNNDNNNNDNNYTPVLNIQVVLTGQFTIEQQDTAWSKGTVCINMVKCALKWVPKHNVVYKDYNIDEHKICQPPIIDSSNTVE